MRPRHLHPRLWLLLGISIGLTPLVTSGCGDATTDPEALFTPAARYAVGFRQERLTYPRAGTGEPRAIDISVWYPASPDATEDFARYTTGGVIVVPTDVALAAPALASGAPFPVVAYSHGGGGESEHAYPYAELLASHGFVVIAPEHLGSTVLDTGDAFDAFERWILDRPADISASLDWLEAPSVPEFAGRTDTTRVALIGYSMGGNTGYVLTGGELDLATMRSNCASADCPLLHDPALEAAYGDLADPRVAVFVAQAAGGHNDLVPGSVAANGVPTMVQVGLLDVSVPVATLSEPLWDAAVRPEDIWVEMPLGAHMSFIPTCNDVPPSILAAVRPTAANDGCGDGFISVDVALEGLAGYAHGFIRAHLLGERRWEAELLEPLRSGFDARRRVALDAP